MRTRCPLFTLLEVLMRSNKRIPVMYPSPLEPFPLTCETQLYIPLLRRSQVSRRIMSSLRTGLSYTY